MVTTFCSRVERLEISLGLVSAQHVSLTGSTHIQFALQGDAPYLAWVGKVETRASKHKPKLTVWTDARKPLEFNTMSCSLPAPILCLPSSSST